jgi:probable phosphoglycerate mutase
MARRKDEGTLRTTVCLVRHGTTPTTGKVLPGRAPGLHLSEQGLTEAERVGERLAGLENVRAVYSSPLERAKETAQAIAKATKCRLRIARGVIECDFGDWTGADLASLRKLPEWQVVLSHPSGFRFPHGESFVELQARIATALQRLVERHVGEVIVVVSHADPIKIAVGDALGVPLDLVQRTIISTASVSVVSYGQGAPVVLAVNSLSDLAGLGIGTTSQHSGSTT